MILNKYDGQNLTITMSREDFVGLAAAVAFAALEADAEAECDRLTELVMAMDLIATKIMNKHEQLKERLKERYL